MATRGEKSWTSLFGATTREIGILIGVFGLLEQLTKCPAGYNTTVIGVVAGLAVVFILLGIYWEHIG